MPRQTLFRLSFVIFLISSCKTGSEGSSSSSLPNSTQQNAGGAGVDPRYLGLAEQIQSAGTTLQANTNCNNPPDAATKQACASAAAFQQAGVQNTAQGIQNATARQVFGNTVTQNGPTTWPPNMIAGVTLMGVGGVLVAAGGGAAVFQALRENRAAVLPQEQMTNSQERQMMNDDLQVLGAGSDSSLTKLSPDDFIKVRDYRIKGRMVFKIFEPQFTQYSNPIKDDGTLKTPEEFYVGSYNKSAYTEAYEQLKDYTFDKKHPFDMEHIRVAMNDGKKDGILSDETKIPYIGTAQVDKYLNQRNAYDQFAAHFAPDELPASFRALPKEDLVTIYHALRMQEQSRYYQKLGILDPNGKPKSVEEVFGDNSFKRFAIDSKSGVSISRQNYTYFLWEHDEYSSVDLNSKYPSLKTEIGSVSSRLADRNMSFFVTQEKEAAFRYFKHLNMLLGDVHMLSKDDHFIDWPYDEHATPYLGDGKVTKENYIAFLDALPADKATSWYTGDPAKFHQEIQKSKIVVPAKEPEIKTAKESKSVLKEHGGLIAASVGIVIGGIGAVVGTLGLVDSSNSPANIYISTLANISKQIDALDDATGNMP